MPALIIDMPSGVAGDMLLGALLGCGGDLERLRTDLLALGLGPIGIEAKPVTRGSLRGWLVDVAADQQARWAPTGHAHDHEHPHDHSHEHGHGHHHHHHEVPRVSLAGAATTAEPVHHHHHHRPYREIRDLIERAALAPRVKERAQRVFRLLAEAEGEAHGVAPEVVEFHEVGAIDAIADVVGCCLLLEQLGIDEIVAGPILPGSGTVRCAHGQMPVPVPAVTAMLARTGAPMKAIGWESGELTTPTGCALVCGLASRFIGGGAASFGGELRVLRSGYGAGHKDFERLVNLVRCTLVEPLGGAPGADAVAEIRCQVDDATGEQLAALVDDLLAAGALDALIAPVTMKKGRPGHLLTVLSPVAERERLCDLLLARSSTIGVRWEILARRTLPRRSATVRVEGREIALKIVRLPDGSERAKPEADDVARVARALGWSFARVQEAALRAFDQESQPK
jgi:uncharacterized protein (TIGR00299 family) protein